VLFVLTIFQAPNNNQTAQVETSHVDGASAPGGPLWFLVGYPLHYRAAFAFSSLLYPLPQQRDLRQRLPPRGRDIRLTLFRLNDTNNAVPACTPAALYVRVLQVQRWKHSADGFVQ